MRYPYTVRKECDEIWNDETKTLKEIIVLVQNYDKDGSITHESNPEEAYNAYCQCYCEWDQRLNESDFQRYIDDLQLEIE